MKKIFKNYIISSLLCFTLYGCAENHELKTSIETFPLATCIDNEEYHLEKLSNYAKSLHYIPLETNNRSLLGQVSLEASYFGDSDFYLFNYSEDKLYKFSESGKFISQIGTQGSGPGEYVNIWDVDVDFSNDKLYIKNRDISIIEYSTEGKFIRNIPIKENFLEKGYYTQHFQKISSNLFIFELVSYRDNQYMGMFSNDSFENPTYLLSSDPIPMDENKNIKFVIMDAQIYKTGKDCYFYQLRSDTIFQINEENLCLTPKYIIDYGQYQPRDNNPKATHSFLVIDSEKYIFWSFNFGKLAPEPFERTISRDGRLITYTETCVSAVYNKKDRTFKLLKQPIPKQYGFLNDLDDGIPFWPGIISSDGKSMFMLCPAETFIETYSGKENLSEEVKAILSQIDEESNPIIIRADFK